MEATTRKLTRQQIAEILINKQGSAPDQHRAIVAFENLQADTEDMAGVFGSGQFVLLEPNDNLPAARVLTTSGDIDVIDAAPLLSLELIDTGVTADTYGAATKLVVLGIDAKGRVVSASEVALNSDNVAEGSTNLYFTNDLARAAISGSGGIAYDPVTGIIGSTGYTGTKTPVTSITVANGIVTAVS